MTPLQRKLMKEVICHIHELDARISSWAGLCTGNNESAEKRRSGKTCKGNVLLRSTLVVCARAAVKIRIPIFILVPGNQHTPWKEESVCGRGTFYAYNYILCVKGRCGFQGS